MNPSLCSAKALSASLELACKSLKAAVDERARGALIKWLELLCEWNGRIDLTAARSIEQLVDLAFADAVALSQLIALDARVIDVGAGAGAPGLPLAILRPDLAVTLAEPSTKRVSFLRTVIGTLDIPVRVVRSRAEELVRQHLRWDCAISRATFEPSDWLAFGAKLVQPKGGKIAVLVAKHGPPSHASARMINQVHYAWPLTDQPRTVCIYENG